LSRRIYLILFIISFFALLTSAVFSQVKVGTEALQMAQLSSSARSNGMGMVSVLLSDNNSFYFNPAQLGFNDNRYGSISFYPVSSEFFLNSDFRSENATINLSKLFLPGESSVNLVAGVQHNYLGSGTLVERTYGNSVDDYPIEGVLGASRIFQYKSNITKISLGMKINGDVEIGFGAALSFFEEKVIGYKVDGVIHDFGGAIKIPIIKRTNKDGNNKINNWENSLSFSASLTNIGGKVTFIDKPFNITQVAYIGSSYYITYWKDDDKLFSVLPVIEWELLLGDYDETTFKTGIELGYSDALFVRRGYVRNPNDDNFSTYGIGLSLKGIKDFLPGYNVEVQYAHTNEMQSLDHNGIDYIEIILSF